MGGPSSFPVTITCPPFPPPCLEGQSLGVVFQQPLDFLRQDNNVTPSGPVLGVGAGSRGLVRAAGSRGERTRKDSSPCLLAQFSAHHLRRHLLQEVFPALTLQAQLSAPGFQCAPCCCPLLHHHFLHSLPSSLLLFSLPQCAGSIWRAGSVWCSHCVLTIGTRRAVGVW